MHKSSDWVGESLIGRLIGSNPNAFIEMEKTKVVIAQPKSRSLRTTIPASIAGMLGIEEGTELGWDLQAKDNQFVLVVRVLGTAEHGPYQKRSTKRSRV